MSKDHATMYVDQSLLLWKLLNPDIVVVNNASENNVADDDDNNNYVDIHLTCDFCHCGIISHNNICNEMQC